MYINSLKLPRYHLPTLYLYEEILFHIVCSFLSLVSICRDIQPDTHTDTQTDTQTDTRDTIAFIYRTSSLWLASLVLIVRYFLYFFHICMLRTYICSNLYFLTKFRNFSLNRIVPVEICWHTGTGAVQKGIPNFLKKIKTWTYLRTVLNQYHTLDCF